MRILFSIVALFFAANLFAQYQVKGTVYNSLHEVLPGASVLIQELKQGTIADENGNFEFANLEKGNYQLKVSFIGFKPFSKQLSVNQDSTVNIILKENAILTEAVFVYATRAGSNTPMATTNVAKTQIEEQNMGQDIPYLLGATPSFVTTSDAGAGIGYTGFRIRGTDANRINVTVNGIPLNDAESHSVFWVNMPDFSSSIENIQIQRGVGTSTNGAAAFGATINMQTSTLQKEAYAEYNGSAGSFNTLKNTVRIGSGLIGDHFSFDARLSKISSDGFIDRAFSNLKSFYVSGGYYTNNTIIKLNIFSGKEKTYQAWNGIPSVRLNNDLTGMQEYEDNWLYSPEQTQKMIASDSRTYNLYTYDNQTDNYQQDHVQLLFSHQLSKYINFNAALHHTYGRGYYEQYRKDDNLADYDLENVIVGSDTITSTNLIRQKWLNNNFYGATFSMNYTKAKSDFTLGGGWNQYDGRHFGNVIWAEYASNGDKDYEWYQNTALKTDFNVYAKYNYSLSEQLNLYTDIQYRNIHHTINGIDDDSRDITQDHPFSFINPKLGIYYHPNANSSAYLSWAVGHREPSRSNFVDADPNGEVPTFETLNDIEAGYRYESSNYSVGANAYFMDYKNQLILTGEINDVGSAIMTNVDDSYRAGIELIAGAKLLENLNWNVNATISQNKIINFTEHIDNWDTWEQEAYDLETTDIAFSPNLIAKSIINYNPLEQLNLSLISQYIGKQYIDNSSNDDRKLDAYFVNNIKISYTTHPKVIKEIEISLLVNNLFNEEYETNAWVYSYLLGGERFKMDGYFPQAGTNFLVGMNIKF